MTKGTDRSPKAILVLFAVILLASGVLAAPVASASSASPNAKQITLTSGNAQKDGAFGASVAVSGTIVDVGAPGETVDGHHDAGYVYAFNASTGTGFGSIACGQKDCYLGESVGIGNDFLVVGAPGMRVDGRAAAGRAITFNATTGATISILESPHPQKDGSFGESVAVSGGLVVVGAQNETAYGKVGGGRAYLFNATTGALIRSLTSPDTQTDGSFGLSVAVSGSIVAVGAPLETAGGYRYAGHAYLFNATTGALIDTLTSPDPQTEGNFGWSVAVSGSIVVVGAPGENANGYANTGQAYAFNTKTGALLSTLRSPNEQDSGFFGWSVALSGRVVVVGAIGETVNGLESAGRAYTFNPQTGKLISTLTSPRSQYEGVFGASVGASSKIVVVGAPGQSANGYRDAGHAYIFGD